MSINIISSQLIDIINLNLLGLINSNSSPISNGDFRLFMSYFYNAATLDGIYLVIYGPF